MTKDIDKIIKICQQYKAIADAAPGYGSRAPETIIEYCQKLKCLGMEFGESIDYADFSIVKNPYITNSATGFVCDPDQYYIVWDNGNVGRLQFVSSDYYSKVEEEWREYYRRLLSYDPLDWDPHNCHMIFSIENGKKLIADYPQICKETREKMKNKIAKAKLEKAKREYERLLEEVGND